MSARLSIIIPVYLEQDNIVPLAGEIAAALKGVSLPYEIVFVDDASNDATWAAIQRTRDLHPEVRGVRHAQNRGQSAAVWTGIQNSTAPLIATLDGDRQNDPADLPRLLKEIETCDFTCGWRQNRKDSWLRRVSSRVAWHARQRALGAAFHDTGCALRVFKRSALEGVFPFNGLHRFLPILVAGNGFQVREVPVNHRPRVAGVSKYGVWNRLGRGIYDLIALSWYQRRRLRPVEVTRFPEV